MRLETIKRELNFFPFSSDYTPKQLDTLFEMYHGVGDESLFKGGNFEIFANDAMDVLGLNKSDYVIKGFSIQMAPSSYMQKFNELADKCRDEEKDKPVESTPKWEDADQNEIELVAEGEKAVAEKITKKQLKKLGFHKRGCPTCHAFNMSVTEVTMGTYIRCDEPSCTWYKFVTNGNWGKDNDTDFLRKKKSGNKGNGHKGEVTPSKGGFWNGAGNAVTYYTRTCVHWKTPVKIGEYTLWASADSDESEGKKALINNKITVANPDLGVYLSHLWDTEVITAAGVLVTPERYPVVRVEWADYKSISVENIGKLVDIIINFLKEGKQVEVGCQGGHGRTGTLISAVIMKVEGLKADAAVLALRARYCEKAVESNEQLNSLRRFGGEPTIPEPEKKVYYSSDKDTDKVWDNALQKFVPARDGCTHIYAVCEYCCDKDTCKSPDKTWKECPLWISPTLKTCKDCPNTETCDSNDKKGGVVIDKPIFTPTKDAYKPMYSREIGEYGYMPYYD